MDKIKIKKADIRTRLKPGRNDYFYPKRMKDFHSLKDGEIIEIDLDAWKKAFGLDKLTDDEVMEHFMNFHGDTIVFVKDEKKDKKDSKKAKTEKIDESLDNDKSITEEAKKRLISDISEEDKK